MSRSKLLSEWSNPFGDIDSFFSDFFRPVNAVSAEGNQVAMPKVDIEEKDKSYVVHADLPGIDKDDIEVSLHDGILSIQAETKKESKEEKDGSIIRRERHVGRFMRKFSLGHDIDENGAVADFDKGVLTLDIPKKQSSAKKPRKLEIN